MKIGIKYLMIMIIQNINCNWLNYAENFIKLLHYITMLKQFIYKVEERRFEIYYLLTQLDNKSHMH